MYSSIRGYPGTMSNAGPVPTSTRIGTCPVLLAQVMSDSVPSSEGRFAAGFQRVMHEHRSRQFFQATSGLFNSFTQPGVVHPAPAIDVVCRPQIVGHDGDSLTRSAILQTRQDAVEFGNHAVPPRLAPPRYPVLFDSRTHDDSGKPPVAAAIREDPGSPRIRGPFPAQGDRPGSTFAVEGGEPGCLHPERKFAGDLFHVGKFQQLALEVFGL